MLSQFLFFILFPIILLIVILVFFFFYPETFDEMYFGKREIGLLIVGSASTMFLDLPVFIYKDYFLALNIGGALIPIILSFYFFVKKAIGFPKFAGGVLLVAVATYMVTRVTETGVVSYFPFYLLPSILAILLAFLLYTREKTTPVYAYAISTIGVILGGDLSHLPELFEQPFAGSFGGAGVYDMVYLAGLISFCISFPFIKKKKRKGKIERMVEKVEKEAICVGKIAGIEGNISFILEKVLGRREDFELLRNEYSVRKARKIMNKLIKEMHEKIRENYAPPEERLVSYLIDFMIISGFSLALSLLYKSIFLPFLMFFLLFQIIYFIPLEFFFGTTVGKALMDMEVRNMSAEKADFLSIFTRNIIRYLEFFAGFYAVSLVLISLSPKRQRIGDAIADSIVIKVRE